MKTRLRTLLLPLFTLLALPATAQVPDKLRHSIPPPLVGTQKGAGLGYSVAVEGGYTVLGAPDDDLAGRNSGVVKVFDSTNGALLFVIPNPGPGYSDSFGHSVAISGTRVVVGAQLDSTGAVQTGSAYVFDLSSGTPTVPMVTINNPSPAELDRFGCSVAISGTRVVVGALSDDTGAQDSGRAYVYELGGATPTVPVVTLNNPGPAVSDNFGWSVGISGTRVVVSALLDDTGAPESGSAYVYDLSSGTPSVPVIAFNNPSPADADVFGWSVAIFGARVVVGAPRDNTGADEAGSAYVYDLGSATPSVPVTTLNNPGPAEDDWFGYSVAISGTRVVVGAYLDDTLGSNVGSAYVYDLGSGTPTVPLASFYNPSPGVFDFFSYSVAISGTRLVIGAWGDDTGAEDAGSAYMYDLGSGTPGSPLATLNNPGIAADDHFGSSVAVSGTRLVVGATGDDTGAEDAGSVYVYDLSSATPTVPVTTLRNPSPAEDDQFGSTVAISGTRVVVGAYYDNTGGFRAGSAYVYDLSSPTPSIPVVMLQKPGLASLDLFGASVAISSSWVVVGAFGEDTGAQAAGSAYVYDLTSGTPSMPVVTLNNPSPGVGDNFGYSVAISGSRVVIGAYTDDTGATEAGSAYVYDLTSGTPNVPVATLNNPSPAMYDNFGWSVAVSGTRVVVGAWGDNTGAEDTGSAYVYDLGAGTPNKPLITLKNPSPAKDDMSGWSVAISGTRVVVGAIGDDAGGEDAGAVYVYDLATSSPGVPVATLKSPSPAYSMWFGSALAIEGANIAIGTPSDSTVLAGKGYAYIFSPETPPVVTTHAPSALSPTGITLNGSVNPNGLATTAQFQYGLTTGYLSTPVNVALAPADGTDAQNVSAVLTGLTAGTLYHYRLSATNSDGTRNTADGTFTTISTNANLSALTLSSGILSPTFASGTTNYTASVLNAINSITLTPTREQVHATIAVQVNDGGFTAISSGSPSGPLSLNVGVNTIDVEVTAQSGLTKKYSITISRAPSPLFMMIGGDSMEFGSIEVFNAQIERRFTISNSGPSALNLTGSPLVALSGPGANSFYVSAMPPASLAAGESSGFAITFDPQHSGLNSAVVTIASNDSMAPSYSFAISGFGALSTKRAQTITFGPPATIYPEQSPLGLSAYASSGLPVTLSVVPAGTTAAGAAIVNNELSFTDTGNVKVQAVQAGDGLYAAATTVVKTITVKANPTVLTLLNLAQTYTGTPRPISTLGGTGTATVEYKMGATFGTTAPTNAGSYPVRATDSKGTKTGTLVIAKAPLYVTPADQRKFVGQDNPPLTLSYSGWVNGESATLVTTAPVLKTTATKASPGGAYPITASGGVVSPNYAFIYQQGALVVDSFVGSYETLLTDSSGGGIVGKLTITVSAANTSFTGKLYCKDEKTALSLNGPLVTNPGIGSVAGSASVTSGGIPYVVNITALINSTLFANVTRGGIAYTSDTGRRLLAGQTIPYSGAHTAALEPATPTANDVPAGAGWATAAISTKGIMTLAGRLGDGTSFTTSLTPDDASAPTYRLFLQPYKMGTTTRLQSYLGGPFTLLPRTDLDGRRYVEASSLTWAKAGLTSDANYSAGFGPVSTVMMLDPWLPPATGFPLAMRLGLTNSSFQVLHSDTGSTLNGDLPTRVGLSATNVVSVTTPAVNTTKWKAKLVPATGLFSGSFELADTTPKPRAVTFTGVLHQPATAPDALIGDGHYLLPPLTGTEKTTGEVMLKRP